MRIMKKALILLSLLLINTTSVKADSTSNHQTYFIETLLNENGGYEAQVITDSSIYGNTIEEKNLKDKNDTDIYIDWTKYSYSLEGKDSLGVSSSIPSTTIKPVIRNHSGIEYGLIFSFPSYGREVEEDYMKDNQRAIKISSTLSSSLNNLLLAIRSDIDYKSLETESNTEDISNTIAIIDEIRPKNVSGDFAISSIGNLKIYYATGSNYDEYKGSPVMSNIGSYSVKSIDKEGNLLAYVVSKESELENKEGFIWCMPKGYIYPSDGKAISSNSVRNYWGVANDKQVDNADASFLSIFSLAEYANAQAKYHNLTLITKNYENTSFIESTIYNFLLGTYSGLLNALKLNTIPDLIYNGGTRGGSSFESGLMNSSWWNTVLKYHIIFQIMVWMMLIVAIAKIIMEMNFSTINPQKTISIMESFQKVLAVGFALALCIPIIKMFATLNNLIVNIFQTQAQTDVNNISNLGFAGIIILFGYLGITFTLNCVYIMRAILIAVLTSSAPIFITSLAFSSPKSRGLIDNWFKEITANIFMQAVHAFAFAFLFDVMDSSNILVQLVIYFSLLPIIDMFRQLIFGSSGGTAIAQGKVASQTVGAFASQVIGGATQGISNLGIGAISKKIGADVKSSDIASLGEQKQLESGKRLNENTANLGTKFKEIGSALTNKDGKTSIKGKALRASGSMLRGASKLGDYIESTGGIMNNSITQANLIDVDIRNPQNMEHDSHIRNSINASIKSGQGVSTGIERVGNDVVDTVENGIQKHNKEKYLDNQNINAAEDDNRKAFMTKISSQNQRRGLITSTDSYGNRYLHTNQNQISKNENGYLEAYLSDEQAQSIYGDNKAHFYNDSNGKYNLGNRYVESNKSSDIKIQIPKYNKPEVDEENYISKLNREESNESKKNKPSPPPSATPPHIETRILM